MNLRWLSLCAVVPVALVAFTACDSELETTAEPDSAPTAEVAPSATGKLNINSASVDELVALPGVGEVIAQRIVDGRPYETVDSLLEIDGIGEGTLSSIRDQVVAE